MLSMQLAKDALADFDIEDKIVDGSVFLRGIRVGQATVEDCICVRTECDDVVCWSGDDVIIAHHTAAENVLNTLLEFSDQVTMWASGVLSFANEDTLQPLVDSAAAMAKNPVMLVDARTMMCVMSGDGFQNVFRDWRYTQLNGRLPWNSLEFMEKDMVFASKLLSAQNRPFVAPFGSGGVPAVVCRIQDPDEDFTAFLFVFSVNQDITDGVLQLAGVAADGVRAWIEGHQGEQRIFSKPDFLTMLANGAQVDAEEMEAQRRSMGFGTGECVLVKILHDRNKSIAWAASVFQDRIPSSRCFEARDSLFALCASYGDLERDLKELARRCDMRFGLSWRFSDWGAIADAVNQTEVALSYTADPVAALNSHCVLFYIFTILMGSTRNIEITHPAIDVLADFDEAHNSEYLRTLWFFLRHERNLVRTAQDLNIHRNSLVYRVKRIAEIIPDVDLDDPETREHLMISFRLRSLQSRAD